MRKLFENNVHVHVHVYSPGAGADNPLGSNFHQDHKSSVKLVTIFPIQTDN